MGVGGQSHTPTASPPGEREPVHTVQEAGWAGLDGCEKSRPPIRIRSLDRPARTDSLHRLSYRGTDAFPHTQVTAGKGLCKKDKMDSFHFFPFLRPL